MQKSDDNYFSITTINKILFYHVPSLNCIYQYIYKNKEFYQNYIFKYPYALIHNKYFQSVENIYIIIDFINKHEHIINNLPKIYFSKLLYIYNNIAYIL